MRYYTGMDEMSLPEAQLYRLLTDLFGSEQVVWGMSALTVCGGELPKLSDVQIPDDQLRSWSQKAKCLFTVLDENDNPKMVVNFSFDFPDAIDIQRLESDKLLEPLLSACGVRYIRINGSEFNEITDPESSYDLFSFLEERFLSPEERTEAL